jgi:hypothetical protein
MTHSVIFTAVNYRIAKGSLNHLVGRHKQGLRRGEDQALAILRLMASPNLFVRRAGWPDLHPLDAIGKCDTADGNGVNFGIRRIGDLDFAS